MSLGIYASYIGRGSPSIPILLFFTSLMVLVYALQNEFQPFLRFEYSFLSSAYTFVPFCQKFLLFNYIILLFSYDWCCMFIFRFITSCKEIHNFNGPGLCFLRFDYLFLSSAYTFVHFCEKIILFNYINFFVFLSLMLHVYFLFHRKLQGDLEFYWSCFMLCKTNSNHS